MAERITRADLLVQVAIIASQCEALGIIEPGAQLTLRKQTNYQLMSGTGTLIGGGWAIIGKTSTEAHTRLVTISDALALAIDATGTRSPWVYPAAGIATIREARA